MTLSIDATSHGASSSAAAATAAAAATGGRNAAAAAGGRATQSGSRARDDARTVPLGVVTGRKRQQPLCDPRHETRVRENHSDRYLREVHDRRRRVQAHERRGRARVAARPDELGECSARARDSDSDDF